ncbi:TerB N-terminal domain-containing protein [Pseudomonas sp. S3E12]|uniref:TerB N-terminal domain-containing protein n=1 Tax=Pseudomonas sp. S3E12 TaxID=1873126 RepID=UPI002113EF75|nr:TerB N-terminal domain-containing protein [Pseudomonas sp. S3E12]
MDVAGLAIPGGLIYLREHATGFGNTEPSLIDAIFDAARSPMGLTDRQMSYWPSYKAIIPRARRALTSTASRIR